MFGRSGTPFCVKQTKQCCFLLISCATRTSCFGCLIACHCFNFVFNPFASQFSFHILPYTTHTIFTTLYIRYSLQWWISIFIIKLVFIMFKGKDTRLCHLRQSIKCCHQYRHNGLIITHLEISVLVLVMFVIKRLCMIWFIIWYHKVHSAIVTRLSRRYAYWI